MVRVDLRQLGRPCRNDGCPQTLSPVAKIPSSRVGFLSLQSLISKEKKVEVHEFDPGPLSQCSRTWGAGSNSARPFSTGLPHRSPVCAARGPLGPGQQVRSRGGGRCANTLARMSLRNGVTPFWSLRRGGARVFILLRKGMSLTRWAPLRLARCSRTGPGPRRFRIPAMMTVADILRTTRHWPRASSGTPHNDPAG